VAVLAFAAMGSAIGAGIGGTFLGVTAASWGWSIGAMVGNALFPASGPDQHNEGPRYTDTKILSSAYGQAIPLVFGTYSLAPNIIWSSAVREVATTTSQDVGGKGGGGQTVTNTTYAYYADVALLLHDGEIVGVRKLKFNGELKYNVADDADTDSVMASALNAAAVRVYRGTETQTADPLIAAAEGNTAPAYRGYAYIVLEDLNVTPYGGKVPQIEAEIVTQGSTAAELAISDGVAVGTTAVINATPGFVLGRRGNIWGLGAVSNTAVRINLFAQSVQSVYTRTLWGYRPISLSPDGVAVFNNNGGFFGTLNEDGTVTEYSAGPAALGSGASVRPVAWDSAYSGYALGDSSSSNNCYRFVTNTTTNQVDEISISAARATHLFTNATGIAGRCYVYGWTVYGHEVGYLTPALSKVLLFSGTQYAPGGLLVSSDGYLWMARSSTGTDVEKRDAAGNLIGSVAIPSGTVFRVFEAPDGYIWAHVSSGACYGIHPATLTIDYTSENTGTKTALGFTEDGRLIFSSLTAGTYYIHQMEPLPRISASAYAAASAVELIAGRVGLVPADLELAALTDNVRGYGIARRMSARAALEPLLAAYRTELVESDDVIKAVKRAGTVVDTVDELDLGARVYGDSPRSPLVGRRLLETELPRLLELRYPDADADYEPGVQPAKRLTGGSVDAITVDLPVVLSATEARQLADVMLYDRWTGRMLYSLDLPRKYAHLEPTDVITVASDGSAYTLRIVAKTELDGLLSFECVAEDAAVHTSSLAGAALPTPSRTVDQSGPTVVRFLDIPILRDADDGAGFYLAPAGYFAGWPGGELWRSVDAGVSYARTDTNFLTAAVIGSTVNALATFAGGNTFDEANTVDVQILSGTLSSSTEALVLAGENAAYVGGEILQFKTATLLGTNQYRLGGLLRGRKGTEQYMTTHAAGESFVLLDAATLKRIAVDDSEIGLARTYKAPAFGQSLAVVSPEPFTLAGVGLKPLAPIQLAAGRTANAAWDVTLKWTRRTRLGGDWRDYADASLGETAESYEVDIYDASFTTLKRTLTSSSPTVTYTNAQQVTDFGSSQSTIYVKVYQLSATIGRGFAAQGTLTA